MELSALDATGAAEFVRAGEVSARELVEASIARIERHNPELGAVVIPLFDEARASLPALPDGPFHGVPIVIKDLLASVAGAPYTGGVPALKRAGYRTPQDSYVIETLRRAGFVLVGKSNTSELGIVPSAEPPCWPPSKNPYDLARTTGGSSGGTAGAVAAGLVPIGHGSDGGGSIRIPASCCGLFGLKPSRGRVSMGPDFGDIAGGLVSEMALTRSVRDAAAVLELLAGPRVGDPYAAPPPRRPYPQELSAPPGRLRIGFATARLGADGATHPSHPDCVAAVEDAARLLGELGHHVEEAEPATVRDPEWVARFVVLWTTTVVSNLDDIAEGLGRPIREDDVEVLTWGLYHLGKMITASGYDRAWRWIHRAARRVAQFWETYDLWLTPTVTAPPPLLGAFRSPPDDPLGGLMAASEFAPFTALINATGQPAASVPLARSAAGLPIGVQLVAAYGREDVLLRVSSQLEAARPFQHVATRA
ncbi:MAG: amidase [Kofleriaceae bacterium]